MDRILVHGSMLGDTRGLSHFKMKSRIKNCSEVKQLLYRNVKANGKRFLNTIGIRISADLTDKLHYQMFGDVK